MVALTKLEWEWRKMNGYQIYFRDRMKRTYQNWIWKVWKRNKWNTASESLALASWWTVMPFTK